MRKVIRFAFPLAAPLLFMGAQGDGCAANSRSPAPDVTGAWNVSYDDTLGVEITIGGQVYDSTLGAAGGQVTIDYQGQPITFDLDCARPDVLCPSEAWPAQVTAEQRDAMLEHQMVVTLPTQSCDGTQVAPDPSTCGAGTDNPDCDDVCDGTVTVTNQERWGVIGESGNTFRLYLGAGVASNGINCALLGWSVADATLDTTGSAATDDWQATGMSDGVVTIGYAGGCLWAGDPNMSGQLQALVIGASVKFTTGFRATRL